MAAHSQLNADNNQLKLEHAGLESMVTENAQQIAALEAWILKASAQQGEGSGQTQIPSYRPEILRVERGSSGSHSPDPRV